ncbi:MAG: hypothetical protein KA072_01900 [Thermoanaerobaculaceae bacterium]|nr:hypothetical protein [Thermoanaerobaculaceae bacterium]MDI9621620.1 hypothetical protein [Acidobacteriota bacterium]
MFEWVHGYLQPRYAEVQLRRGPGDKGRDIVAWIDPPGTARRRLDVYQCKHYQSALTPGEVWVELGKLCYHTHAGGYPVPQGYYLVAPRGCGSTLQDLLDNPERLRFELQRNWEKHCAGRITNRDDTALSGSLAAHVATFNFAIVHSVSPGDLINQHAQTRYHALVFGTGLSPRPPVQPPPTEVAPIEARYVAQFLDAAADRLRQPLGSRADLGRYPTFDEHFRHTRECFYSAEALKEFARDTLPDEGDFGTLKEDVYDGIITTVLEDHSDGYSRLVRATEVAGGLALSGSVLLEDLTQKDRIGLCHHLANEDRVTWVRR